MSAVTRTRARYQSAATRSGCCSPGCGASRNYQVPWILAPSQHCGGPARRGDRYRAVRLHISESRRADGGTAMQPGSARASGLPGRPGRQPGTADADPQAGRSSRAGRAHRPSAGPPAGRAGGVRTTSPRRADEDRQQSATTGQDGFSVHARSVLSVTKYTQGGRSEEDRQVRERDRGREPVSSLPSGSRWQRRSIFWLPPCRASTEEVAAREEQAEGHQRQRHAAARADVEETPNNASTCEVWLTT
jgi:hypothetical protein